MRYYPEHVGQKVKVHFGFVKSIERVLKEDKHGLYIEYNNQRVPVRIDRNVHHSAKNYIADPSYLRSK